MSEPRRVVITGIGAITPIGLGVGGLWDGLRRRRSAVRCITRFDPTAFKSRIAGEVPDFVPTDHIEERRARRLDRYSQFTLAATRMALADATAGQVAQALKAAAPAAALSPDLRKVEAQRFSREARLRWAHRDRVRALRAAEAAYALDPQDPVLEAALVRALSAREQMVAAQGV
jgi:3-oxoacyl-(acyl-carrier-protein) synthase